MTGVCSPYVVSMCDFAYYVVGYDPAIAVQPFVMLCLSAISMFVKIMLAVCMVV